MRNILEKTMRDNTTLSPPAEAGNSIDHELRKELMGCFEVQEMPFLKNSIKMNLADLEAFCKRAQPNSLPIFQIKVEEMVQGNVRFPVERSYMKYFTIWGDWCFYALEPLSQTKEMVMDGGEILVA